MERLKAESEMNEAKLFASLREERDRMKKESETSRSQHELKLLRHYAERQRLRN